MFNTNLLHLLHLCDPSLPIGGFSHSAGLETYVQQGKVKDKQTLHEFVVHQLSQNILYTDAAILSLAYDAAVNDEIETVLALDELCTAVKLPREMRSASNKLGLRLLKIFTATNQSTLVQQYSNYIKSGKADGHYCIAFALLASALDINKQDALTGFFYNAAIGFITNGVKLIPLGQQDGQEILMQIFPLIEQLAQQSITPDSSMIGFCCSGFDIRSMQHEQLYTRLYMS